MISALKGRRPRPLDERGVHVTGGDCTPLFVLCQAKIVVMWQMHEYLYIIQKTAHVTSIVRSGNHLIDVIDVANQID